MRHLELKLILLIILICLAFASAAYALKPEGASAVVLRTTLVPTNP